jgi:acyl-CoA thioester hydrolase
MERGRTNYLRLLGADQRALFAGEDDMTGVAFAVRHMEIDFRKSARMDDVLEVITLPAEVRGASLTLAQEVRRGGDVLIEAKVKVACVSNGRARRIPLALRKVMGRGWLTPSGATKQAVTESSRSCKSILHRSGTIWVGEKTSGAASAATITAISRKRCSKRR